MADADLQVWNVTGPTMGGGAQPVSGRDHLTGKLVCVNRSESAADPTAWRCVIVQEDCKSRSEAN